LSSELITIKDILLNDTLVRGCGGGSCGVQTQVVLIRNLFGRMTTDVNYTFSDLPKFVASNIALKNGKSYAKNLQYVPVLWDYATQVGVALQLFSDSPQTNAQNFAAFLIHDIELSNFVDANARGVQQENEGFDGFGNIIAVWLKGDTFTRGRPRSTTPLATTSWKYFYSHNNNWTVHNIVMKNVFSRSCIIRCVFAGTHIFGFTLRHLVETIFVSSTFTG
jgi:hypothetical protein